MIKKLIAASLSLTMLISTAAADGFNFLYAGTRSKAQHDPSDSSSETQLKGNNSFGKFIEKTASEDKNEGIRPLSLKADPENYKVANLDFDLVSGKLTAVTSQSSACILKISFINDDNENDVYEMTSPVSQGERCETILSVDKSMMPEFFKVTAVLTDVYGNELSETFSISKYMRFMQELSKATVDDYNEDYVVNLDNDDTTNFFVLNEETVIADISDNENTLVSADYDNDVYVFDNINDSIRYLSAGDYFYAQPDEKNIVAVNVESVDIDGDTATIRGGNDLDDMFDIIKIDVGMDNIDPSELEEAGNEDNIVVSSQDADEENDDYSVIYNGVGEDENGKPALEYSVLSYGDTNTPKSDFSFLGFNAKKVSKDGQKIKIPFEWKIGTPKPIDKTSFYEKDEFGRNKVDDFVNINKPLYKSADKDQFKYDQESNLQAETGFEAAFSASIKITLEGNLTYYKYKKDYEFGWDGYTEAKLEAEGNAKFECTFTMLETPIPTPIPGISVELKGEIKIGIEASVTISTGIKLPYKIHRGSYGGGEDNEIEKTQSNKFEIEGDFYFEFTPSASFSLFIDILCVSLEFPIKFKVSVTPLSMETSADTGIKPEIGELFFSVPAPENASKYEPLHACKRCLKITPSISVKVKVNLKFPFVKKMTLELAEKEWEFEAIHWSFTTKVIGVGECRNYFYAADFHIIGNDEVKAQGLVVEVDGEKQLTGSGDTVCFFLKPDKWHTYKIYSKDELIKSGDFFIRPEYTKFDIKLDGGISTNESEPVVTTTTVYTEPTTHTVESAIDTIINERPEHAMLEYGQLGDNVHYSLYPDGYLYISGYGPMNKSDDPIQNKELVKNILFEDYSTLMKAIIAEDTTNEKLIEKYVEKYQDELCDLYLEKHKDDLLKTLNENYGIDPEDSDIDEIIENHIAAHSTELAHEYYDRHTADYGDKLADFKKELLSDLDDKVITSIGNNAFKNCENLESITYEGSPNEGKKAFDLPNTITAIGSNAFCNCKALDFGDVVLGDRVESIGTAAFMDCPGLKSIRVPISVKSMGQYVFSGCVNLTNATIEADTDTLGIGTFWKCLKLEELTLPMSVKIINYDSEHPYELVKLFTEKDTNDSNWIVPETLKKISLLRGDTINDYAFRQFHSLDIIALPQEIKHINEGAFSGLTKMNIICSDETKDLTFSELFADLETVGKNAFDGCQNLEIGDLDFGDKLVSIGKNAFKDCFKVTRLHIPASVTAIDSLAFNNCKKIEKVAIDTDIVLNEGILYGCPKIRELTLATINNTKPIHTLDSNYVNALLTIFADCSRDNPWTILPHFENLTFLSGKTIPENYFFQINNVDVLELPNELKFVDSYATHDLINSSTPTKVIYHGTEDEWDKIEIKDHNEPLEKSKVTFAPAEETKWITGDANGDGQIDMSDIVLIMQALANPDKYGINGTDPTHITAEGFKYADTDQNGLTVNDAANIQKFLLGINKTVSGK
ncbi:MAG: leucine-rich repeat protein [Ruminococcus sp.]|uniref:leucine-rich repeat protein n=1 Tax=Ruminococcus sp. TaxID=41978 RepID=UPI0025CE0BAC|nr:leucine-rich repeat protein [Ruminococcus sp.]MCR5599881.1 leucine-rich repeat protein [Ruminococcus sp.]